MYLQWVTFSQGGCISNGVPCKEVPAFAGMTTRADDGKNEKAPLAVYGKRGVNPAATYSPGPGGQVPSAI